jgi:hypothetical protein
MEVERGDVNAFGGEMVGGCSFSSRILLAFMLRLVSA